MLAMDATDCDAPRRIFAALRPDVVIVCGGAKPLGRPIHEMTWEEFAVNWDSDVKMSFFFLSGSLARAARTRVHGYLNLQWSRFRSRSPMSGGYAGAKRTQMFIANYAQKESDRLNSACASWRSRRRASCPRRNSASPLSSVMLAILGFLRRNSSRGWSHGRHQRMLRMRSRNLPATAQPIGKRIHHIRRGIALAV